MKKQKKKTAKKGFEVNNKYVHVTLHKLTNQNIDYWLEKANTFRANTVARLVGLEENHEEGKGHHAHIFIQWSTKQQLSRAQFVKHFETDSIHINTPGKEKKDVMQVLGYAMKTGNYKQIGEFTYRGVKLNTNPEVYRFQMHLKSDHDKLGAIAYFEKILEENPKDKKIIEKFAGRKDAIGHWLVGNPTVRNQLHKLAHVWNLQYRNSRKKGFGFAEFTENKEALKKAYEEYLKEFPVIFEREKPKDSPIILEKDYDQHTEHDLKSLRLILRRLKEATEYGSNRPHKTLNLFIWSYAPSFGKSRLLKFLDENMMCYRLPDDQYYVDYENGVYQILVSDEAAQFIQTKSYSHLKHILEGAKVEFNMKNRTKIIKEDNPLIVLADNVSFDSLMRSYFSKNYTKEVMDTRVLDVQLKSRATLHFLLDRCLIKKTK